MKKSAATLAVAFVLLAGCGRQEQTTSQQAPAAAPAVAAAPAAAAPAKPAPAPEDAAAVAAAAEDGESVDQVTLDVSPVAAAVAANTPGPAAPAAFRWTEGQHFNPLPLAQPTSVAAGNVEVTEIFWYGCGHCYALETQLDNWDRKLRPSYVRLNRLPVVWNAVTREDARLYYTLEALGRLRDLHTLVFREIHVNRNPFTIVQGQTVDEAATERRVREFLTKNGVSEADIARTYRSFATENRLRQAENLSRRYLADHTPMVIVNGKYSADVTSAGGPDQLFQLINDLAARERGTR